MKSIAFLFSLISFRFILDVSYAFYITEEFDHYQLNFSNSQYFVSILLFLIPIYFLNNSLQKPSDLFLLWFMIFSYTPITTLYGLDNTKTFIPILFYLLAFLTIYVSSRIKLQKAFFQTGRFNSNQFLIIFCIITVFLVALRAYLLEVPVNLTLSSLYDFREDNAKIVNQGIFAYINSWTYQIINIFLIIHFLRLKNYLLASLFIIMQIYFYGISAQKSILAMPFVIIGIWYLFSKRTSLLLLSTSLFFLILLCLSSYLIFDEILTSSIVIRRVFFTPAYLTYEYINFFEMHGNLYWSGSFLSNLIQYPYSEPYVAEIGYQLFGDDTKANNGFFASGYANAGYPGVIIYTLILGLLIRIIDLLAISNIPIWVTLSITLIPIHSIFTSTDLLTGILTHGLVIAMLILLIYSNHSYINHLKTK